jgi:DNA-binding response OmpR family regulator
VRSLYLLHVEDDDNDAFFVERAFANAKIDLTIQRVSDGQAAIDYLSGVGKYQNREKYPLPQIMLLDLKLPLRDGFEVLEWAREQHAFRSLPIIVLSSSAEPKDTLKASRLGATAYVVKMIGFRDLLEKINVFLLPG